VAERPTVAVVGGGIAGLAAAHRLTTEPVKLMVVDKAPQLGGKVHTEHIDGFVVENGPDSFVAGKGTVVQLAEELSIGHRIISTRPENRGSYVWRRGELHPLPEGLILMTPTRISPLLRSTLLSWRGRLRVLADLVIPRGRPSADESLESFVVRRLGREALDRIAEPLIAGIHVAEPATMSLRASFPRFLDMEREHRSLIPAARAAARLAPQPGSLSHFASFQAGMGELTDTLVAALGDAETRTGTAVTLLTHHGDGYRLALDDGTDLDADAVIIATPARDAAALLSEIAPKAAREVAAIRQISTATITLAYRAHQIPELAGSGFVIPTSEQRRIMGVSYISNKWQGRVPDPGFVQLRAFVAGPHNQQLVLGGQERLVAAAREELATLMGITAHPVLVRTNVWERGLHQYTLGHLERVARAEQAIRAAAPLLALAGAAFHGIGLNECVTSGRQAAEGVVAAIISPGTARSPKVIPSQ
jgi:oxygen-dependent protoporphyrinogen oxidase